MSKASWRTTERGGAGAARAGGAVPPDGAVLFDAGGCADCVVGALPPPMADNACWQGAETLAAFCCRHFSAGVPPVGTPEQCAWKSARQFCRIALCCAEVGCCAARGPARPARISPTKTISPQYAGRGIPAVRSIRAPGASVPRQYRELQAQRLGPRFARGQEQAPVVRRHEDAGVRWQQ
jgi:hypothetical protein